MKRVKRFQQGGPMDPVTDPGMDLNMDPAMGQETDPGMGGQPSPEEELMMIAQEIIGQMGPEGAAMLAEVIMMMLQEGGGGGMPPQEPTFAKLGGKLVRIG